MESQIDSVMKIKMIQAAKSVDRYTEEMTQAIHNSDIHMAIGMLDAIIKEALYIQQLLVEGEDKISYRKDEAVVRRSGFVAGSNQT